MSAKSGKQSIPTSTSNSVGVLNNSGKNDSGFSGVIISPEDILPICDIKSGMQGRVYRARVGSAEVAVKEIKINLSGSAFDNAKRNLKKEVQIMSEVNHENICLFLGACLIPDKMMLVSELCVTDLNDYMKKIDSLFSRIELSRDICKGMAWLHDVCGIVHLDLKPANLLIDKHGRIKITDFGYSQILPTHKFTTQSKEKGETGGTPRYMAPERFVGGHSNLSVDVYSFGIILWEMVTLTMPFKEHDNMNKFVSCIFRGERPSTKDIKDGRLVKVMQMCWNSDPKARPPFTSVLPILDKILLNMAIPDPDAQKFWVTVSSYCGYAVDLTREVPNVPTKAKQTAYILPITVSWKNFISGLDKILQKHSKLHTEDDPIDLVNSQCPPTNLSSKIDYPNPKKNQIERATTTALTKLQKEHPEFTEQFQKEMDRRKILTKVYALKRLLIDDHQKEEEVDIQKFGKLVAILGWKSKNDNCPAVGLLDTVFELSQKSWFFPYSSKESSFEILKNSPIGTFVIRFSHSSNGIALSKVIKESTSTMKVIHFLLTGNPEKGYALPGQNNNEVYYPTIQELVEADSSLVPPSGNHHNVIQMKDIWDSDLYRTHNYTRSGDYNSYFESSSSNFSSSSSTLSINHNTILNNANNNNNNNTPNNDNDPNSSPNPNEILNTKNINNISNNHNTLLIDDETSSLRDLYLYSGKGMNSIQIKKKLEHLKKRKTKLFSLILDSDHIDENDIKLKLGRLVVQIESLQNCLKKDDE